MTKLKIGFLHPGAMGISLAASAQNSGHTVYWVSAERSAQTQERAAEHNLVEVGSLNELCETCSVIVSVCPPHAAEEVARQTLETSFEGFYLDANQLLRLVACAGADRRAGIGDERESAKNARRDHNLRLRNSVYRV